MVCLELCGGKDLGSIGASIPTSIQDALDKSPELRGLGYSKATYAETQDTLETSLTNQGNTVRQTMLEGAERIASDRVSKRMRYMAEAILGKDKEL